MREDDFRDFLINNGYTLAAVNSRIEKLKNIEYLIQNELEEELEAVVCDNDKMYKSLLMIKKQDDDHRNGQNALRRYYEYRRGKNFPTIRQYERNREKKGKSRIEEIFLKPCIGITLVEKTGMGNLHKLAYSMVDIVALLSSFERIIYNQELLDEKNSRLFPSTDRKSTVSVRDVEIVDFHKGSLCLEILSNVAAGVILLLIQEVYKKKHPDRPNAFEVNLNNCVIVVNKDEIKTFPSDSLIGNAVLGGSNKELGKIDAKNLVEDIVRSSDPDENLEQSIGRMLNVLVENNVIDKKHHTFYNSSGFKVLYQAAERVGNGIFDERV